MIATGTNLQSRQGDLAIRVRSLVPNVPVVGVRRAGVERANALEGSARSFLAKPRLEAQALRPSSALSVNADRTRNNIHVYTPPLRKASSSETRTRSISRKRAVTGGRVGEGVTIGRYTLGGSTPGGVADAVVASAAV